MSLKSLVGRVSAIRVSQKDKNKHKYIFHIREKHSTKPPARAVLWDEGGQNKGFLLASEIKQRHGPHYDRYGGLASIMLTGYWKKSEWIDQGRARSLWEFSIKDYRHLNPPSVQDLEDLARQPSHASDGTPVCAGCGVCGPEDDVAERLCFDGDLCETGVAVMICNECHSAHQI